MYLESDQKLRELLKAENKIQQEEDIKHFENVFVESGIFRKTPLCKSDDEIALQPEVRLAYSTEIERIHFAESTEENSRWECYKCHIEMNSSNEVIAHYKLCMVKTSCKMEWRCKFCKRSFPTKNEHQSHAKCKGNYHLNVDQQFVCNLCSNTFRTRKSVYDHIRKKHGNKKELCNICGKFLSDRNNLQKHYRTVHLKEKNYPCTVCDKRFDSSYRLRMHLNSHDGIRPFTCNFCPSSFFTSSCLAAHKTSVHNVGKKHVCTICSRSFSLAYNMRQHMATHTGIRAHICKHCGAGFQRKNKLQTHLKEAHGS